MPSISLLGYRQDGVRISFRSVTVTTDCTRKLANDVMTYVSLWSRYNIILSPWL